MKNLKFPHHFVWGAATSAYQIEGAVKDDGRGESIWDRFSATPNRIEDASNGDVACDHYHRWPTDVDLMQRLDLAAYRFSIAWPRVFPKGRGPLNAAGLDFYDRLVDGLLAKGITPYITLYHWDLPQALEDEGGWVNRETVEAFVVYVDAVTRKLGDRVAGWITHNEPWCASMLGYCTGRHAPGIRDWPRALVASHHLLLSHGLAVNVIRSNVKNASAGITLNLTPTVPASPSVEDYEASRHMDGFQNRWFLDPLYRRQYPADMLADYSAKGYLPRGTWFIRPGDMDAIATHTDFLGVNYYNRTVCRSESIPEEKNMTPTVRLAPKSEWTEMGWEVYPDGLFQILTRVSLEYMVPKIYVTENGASYSEGPDATGRVADVRRTRFVQAHLASAHRALEAGVPLAGYFVWSLLDNFEWDRGYTQRFGITWVDYATQKRVPKDCALWYRSVIAENGITLES